MDVGGALGTIVPLAVAIAIFPIPVVASVLVVGGDRGRLRGALFVGGWLAGLAGVGALVLLVGTRLDAGDDDGDPATWTSAIVLLLGVMLFALAVKQWQARPGRDEHAPVPTWMKGIDQLGNGRVAGLGFALSGLNPKNVLLTVAAAAEIAYFELPADQEIVVLTSFAVIASTGVLAPLGISVALGDRSEAVLEGLRGWMVKNNATVMSVLFVVIGAKLVGDAIAGLSD